MDTTTTTPKTAPLFSTPEVSDWFGQLVHQINLDEIELQAGVANAEKAEFYKNAIAGNTEALLKSIRVNANQTFVHQILEGFLTELSVKKVKPSKLAFALTPATILAWVEISDNDELTEDAILLAEAKINSTAKEYDFCLDTMVVEKADGLQIPSHYIAVIS